MTISRVDTCSRAASRLMTASQLPAEEHTLLRENLATYLHHLKPDFVEELSEARDPIFTLKRGYANGDMRWTRKAFRDLEKPYTDTEVFQRVEELNQGFAALVREQSPAIPTRYFVTGSLLKGRFGAHSDLDLVVETTDTTQRDRHGSVSAQVVKEGEPRAKAFGRYQEIESESPDLLQLFKEGYHSKGYRFEGRSLVAEEPIERTREEVPSSGMIWNACDMI